MQYDPLEQRRFALEVLSKLRTEGFTAYWAGGCVRDELLRRRPKDYDVATNARPEQIRALFGPKRTLAVGEAFGVIVVVGPRAAGMVEVTTFRRDAGYSDGRRPDAVVFTDAEEDARRRDFTMNALFFDPLENRVIDFVDGRADIERKIVRAVGDPRERFSEDKLRMLRAVRMAAVFGFALDAATMGAIRDLAGDIRSISPERIAQECRGMFGKPGQAEAARLLETTNLLRVLFPEVSPLLTTAMTVSTRTYWSHTLELLAELERRRCESLGVAFAALLHEVGRTRDGAIEDDQAAAARGSQIVGQIARRLRMSNEEREQAMWVVARQFDLRGAANQPWSKVQPLLSHAHAADLVELSEAEAAVAGQSLDDSTFCRAKLALDRSVLDPPPLVTGDDLIGRGLRPGKAFARLLREARAAQLDGQVTTTDEAIRFVESLLPTL